MTINLNNPKSEHRRSARFAWRTSFVALTVIFLLPVIFLFGVNAMASKPKNLGVTGGRLAPCPSSPNCVSSQAQDAKHRVEPIPLTGSPDEAMRRIMSVIAIMPRMKIVAETEDYLHVEAASRFFRFVDDVEFFVDPKASVIHVRSASRVGYADFGVNRARVEQIRKALR